MAPFDLVWQLGELLSSNLASVPIGQSSVTTLEWRHGMEFGGITLCHGADSDLVDATELARMVAGHGGVVFHHRLAKLA